MGGLAYTIHKKLEIQLPICNIIQLRNHLASYPQDLQAHLGMLSDPILSIGMAFCFFSSKSQTLHPSFSSAVDGERERENELSHTRVCISWSHNIKALK